MTEAVKVIILATLQGLTEFLPVSSSGHLGIAQHLLNFDHPGLMFEVTVHAGTLLSVILYYRRRLARILADLSTARSDGRATLGYLILGSLPVIVAGLTFRKNIEALIENPHVIAIMLIVTSAMLLSLFLPSRATTPLTPVKALLIGMAQSCAILPGISRSGATITAGRHLGLDPRTAAEFSLLLMLPAIGGAILLQGWEATRTGLGGMTPGLLALAFVIAATVGYAAILILVRSLATGVFKWFGCYTLTAGILALVLV